MWIALPQITNETTFDVSWSGEDDPDGSGLASYDVYVSDDGVSYTNLAA